MKIHFLLFTLLFISSSCQSQSDNKIYLWPGEVPGESEAKHDPVQTDNTSGNVIRLTDITNPKLIVYEPDPSMNNGAGVIVCPGGGYKILAIDLEGYEIAKWLNKLGYTAFVLEYRVPNKQAGALNDIQRAIRIVRKKTDKWGLNPDKLGVLGFSAGASLSARVSTRFNDQTYSKIDKADDLSCRPDFAVLMYPGLLDNGENRSLTPEISVGPDTPPMFIFATADDRHANSALVMATALRDAKAPVELHLLPEGGHGYGLRKGNVAAETWPGLVEKWLKGVISD